MKKIKKVLISNRGEIACRILRTLDRMGIPSVLVYHAADADSPAVNMATEVVEIDGQTPVAAYLDMDSMVAACKATNSDALHPGFGFLAENAELAKRLANAGITFIGPTSKNIELMGNKIQARTFCIDNGFPLSPSVSEDGTGKQFVQQAKELGMPLLIKAVAGGGGKGMQIVRHPKDLESALKITKTTALRAFGNDRVYAERYEETPRHIEVQILADKFGNIVHLGERECSIQRRFQKIIEESPAPALESDLRKRICKTAVEIARKAGYRNAGTVEFLLSPDGDFYFLEMNTRIQVEHPVTEMVTGIDIVEMQVRIAQGEPLPFHQEDIKPVGNAIELRIYAEDPENDFMPTTGQVLSFSLPRGDSVRVDHGLTEGIKVTAAFDPMLAKLIVHGKTREEAIRQVRNAIADTWILGVTTNADYLARVVSHPAFASGLIHTGFIPKHSGDLKPPELTTHQRYLLVTAVALGSREISDPEFVVEEPYASIGMWRT